MTIFNNNPGAEDSSIIPNFIQEQMLEDLRIALNPSPGADNYFSTLDEYKYIVERNTKFHLSLAFIQSQFIRTLLPFADIDFLSMALCVPLATRENKGVLDKLLHYVNPRLTKIGSSANTEYFYGASSRLRNGTFLERMKYKKFRLLNICSQTLAKLSNGGLRLGNPFQTENQISVYRNSFESLSSSIQSNEALCECLGATAIEQVLRNGLVLRNLEQRFHLICLHKLSLSKVAK